MKLFLDKSTENINNSGKCMLNDLDLINNINKSYQINDLYSRYKYKNNLCIKTYIPSKKNSNILNKLSMSNLNNYNKFNNKNSNNKINSLKKNNKYFRIYNKRNSNNNYILKDYKNNHNSSLNYLQSLDIDKSKLNVLNNNYLNYNNIDNNLNLKKTIANSSLDLNKNSSSLNKLDKFNDTSKLYLELLLNNVILKNSGILNFNNNNNNNNNNININIQNKNIKNKHNFNKDLKKKFKIEPMSSIALSTYKESFNNKNKSDINELNNILYYNKLIYNLIYNSNSDYLKKEILDNSTHKLNLTSFDNPELIDNFVDNSNIKNIVCKKLHCLNKLNDIIKCQKHISSDNFVENDKNLNLLSNNNLDDLNQYTHINNMFISKIANKSTDFRNNKIEKLKINTGRWSKEEHRKFIEGIIMYGNNWSMIQDHIKTRTNTQSRSHSQKFFLKLKDFKGIQYINYAHSIEGLNNYSKSLSENKLNELKNELVNVEYEDILYSKLSNNVIYNSKKKFKDKTIETIKLNNLNKSNINVIKSEESKSDSLKSKNNLYSNRNSLKKLCYYLNNNCDDNNDLYCNCDIISQNNKNLNIHLYSKEKNKNRSKSSIIDKDIYSNNSLLNSNTNNCNNDFVNNENSKSSISNSSITNGYNSNYCFNENSIINNQYNTLVNKNYNYNNFNTNNSIIINNIFHPISNNNEENYNFLKLARQQSESLEKDINKIYNDVLINRTQTAENINTKKENMIKRKRRNNIELNNKSSNYGINDNYQYNNKINYS